MKHARAIFLTLFPAATALGLISCGGAKASTSASSGGSSGSGSSSGASAGTSSGSSAGAAGSATCASPPAGTTYYSNYDAATATCSTHITGKWTALTIQEPTGATAQGDAQCDADAPYADQATFDANESGSTASGTTIVSNHDYVVTTSCASGSVQYTTSGSAEQKILFVWTKNP